MELLFPILARRRVQQVFPSLFCGGKREKIWLTGLNAFPKAGQEEKLERTPLNSGWWLEVMAAGSQGTGDLERSRDILIAADQALVPALASSAMLKPVPVIDTVLWQQKKTQEQVTEGCRNPHTNHNTVEILQLW